MRRRQRTAVYGGSFDPVTKGHEWVIEETLELFDKLHIVVGVNATKKPMFDLNTRQELIESVCGLYGKRVVVQGLPPNMFLVNFAKMVGATHLIRGIRNATDLEAERLMRQVNHRICPSVRTLFLHTPKEFEEVSSSMVKSLMGIDGWDDLAYEYVAPCVVGCLREMLQARTPNRLKL
jgi:pantetheine-phosphate adenylyltransferase